MHINERGSPTTLTTSSMLSKCKFPQKQMQTTRILQSQCIEQAPPTRITQSQCMLGTRSTHAPTPYNTLLNWTPHCTFFSITLNTETEYWVGYFGINRYVLFIYLYVYCCEVILSVQNVSDMCGTCTQIIPSTKRRCLII